jgi:DNA helicase-2/ATP-dependent DNA helicase PcrA
MSIKTVNPIQERLVRALHDLGADVKIVGDDDQTIFQWRGSDADNILQFTDRYPRVKTIRMEDNFRSSDGVIDVARLSIEKNQTRLPKAMRPAGLQKYEVGDITALQFADPNEEAAYIANTCKQLRGTFIREGEKERAISWSDMAVLVRVTACTEPIRRALLQAGVPCVSVGMNTLFDAPEAEAARQLFYMMVGRASRKDVLAAWENANLGVTRASLLAALKEAEATRAKMTVETRRSGSRFTISSGSTWVSSSALA